VEVCRGDVLDIGSLAAALTGVDAVVSALGTRLELRPVTVLSQGTGNLIAAMTQAGIARLICITGPG
jgi:putative NADH-flavin reductase